MKLPTVVNYSEQNNKSNIMLEEGASSDCHHQKSGKMQCYKTTGR